MKAAILNLIPKELFNSGTKKGALLNIELLDPQHINDKAEIVVCLTYEHRYLQIGLLLHRNKTWKHLIRDYGKWEVEI